MRRLTSRFKRLVLVLAVAGLAGLSAQESEVTPLPDPQITGGKPLMEALNERMTRREFSPERLSH